MSYWSEKPREGMSRDEKAALDKSTEEKQRKLLSLKTETYGDRRPGIVAEILESLTNTIELVNSNRLRDACRGLEGSRERLTWMLSMDLRERQRRETKKRQTAKPTEIIGVEDEYSDDEDFTTELGPNRLHHHLTLYPRNADKVIIDLFQGKSQVRYKGKTITEVYIPDSCPAHIREALHKRLRHISSHYNWMHDHWELVCSHQEAPMVWDTVVRSVDSPITTAEEKIGRLLQK